MPTFYGDEISRVNGLKYAANCLKAVTKVRLVKVGLFYEPKFDGPGHVAIYIGNDQIIEAPHTGALVRVSSFSRAAVRMGFLGAVRPYTVVVAAIPQAPPVTLRAE